MNYLVYTCDEMSRPLVLVGVVINTNEVSGKEKFIKENDWLASMRNWIVLKEIKSSDIETMKTSIELQQAILSKLGCK